jgi:hypothetical protein
MFWHHDMPLLHGEQPLAHAVDSHLWLGCHMISQRSSLLLHVLKNWNAAATGAVQLCARD